MFSYYNITTCRVHTLCVPITSELSDMYRAADAGATAAMLAKLSVERSLGARLDETRLQLQSKVRHSMAGGIPV